MVEEYEFIMNNEAWEVVPRPKDKSLITSKWLYKIKHGVDGSVEEYKARFIAHGFSQKERLEYYEVLAWYTTTRSTIALAANQGWSLHQRDVKTTFLHGLHKEEVYLEQP